MESDIRYYRRRASEELAAADRAVTAAARERRMQLAGAFLDRLRDLQPAAANSAFDWSKSRSATHVQG